MEPDILIEDGAILGTEVSLKGGTIIRKGAVLGNNIEGGRWLRVGRANIADDVFIGKYVVIGDWGCLLAYPNGTYIGRNSYLENWVTIEDHVYIGEGTHIGEGTIIRAGAMLRGYTRTGREVSIGEGTTLGYGVTLRDRVTLGNGVFLGDEVELGSGITLGDGVHIRSRDDVVWIGPVGSRMAVLCVARTPQGIIASTGCRCEPIDRFLRAVKETHGNSHYGWAYRAAVKACLSILGEA